MSKDMLRCYAFVNSTMSDIQRAVQSAHACTELYHINRGNNLCIEWAESHKTLVLLCGGNHGNMVKNYKLFSKLCNGLNLPHAPFYEDWDTMCEQFTAFVGIIPESIYDMEVTESPNSALWWDAELATFLQHARLLR